MTIKLGVASEVGRLRRVLVHRPGPEVLNMTPELRERLLFDDILHLERAQREHDIFRRILELIVPPGANAREYVLDSADLLRDLLTRNADVREALIRDVCLLEGKGLAIADLMHGATPDELAEFLLSGEMPREDPYGPRRYPSLTAFMQARPYKLRPVPNLMFTRDAAAVVNQGVLVCNMAFPARLREPLLMRYIYRYHPLFGGAAGGPALWFDRLSPETLRRRARRRRMGSPADRARIEGGDVLVVRQDVLFIGCGERTTTQGIDALVRRLAAHADNPVRRVYAVMMPRARATIHLDTIFTLISQDECLLYPPLILPRGEQRVRVVRIDIPARGQDPRVTEVEDLLRVLQREFPDRDIRAWHCGGSPHELASRIDQDREQWTDGANAFALRPGLIVCYERNERTAAALAQAGYQIFRPEDYLDLDLNVREDVLRSIQVDDWRHKYAVLIRGQELSRARGGPRCMTMPLQRDPLPS